MNDSAAPNNGRHRIEREYKIERCVFVDGVRRLLQLIGLFNSQRERETEREWGVAKLESGEMEQTVLNETWAQWDAHS